MIADARKLLAIAILTSYALALGGTRAMAQDPGLGGMLGGYGAMAGDSGSPGGGGDLLGGPSGMGANVIVPFAGMSGTLQSSGPGGGAGMTFASRSSSPMYARRPSFALDSMGGMNRTDGRRPFALQPSTLTGGMGLGSGMRRMPAAGGMGVMPPRISYPFRQPPGRLTTSAADGMSM
jgi:hypothetical protein